MKPSAAGSKPDKKDRPGKDGPPFEVGMEPAKGSKPDKKPAKKPGSKPDKKPGSKPDKQQEDSDLTPKQEEYLHAMTDGKLDLSQAGPKPNSPDFSASSPDAYYYSPDTSSPDVSSPDVSSSDVS